MNLSRPDCSEKFVESWDDAVWLNPSLFLLKIPRLLTPQHVFAKKKRILSTTTQEVTHHVDGWDRWLLHKMSVFSLVIVSPEPINPDKGISNATLQSGLPRQTWLTKWIWFFDVSLIVYWFRFLTWFTRGELTYQRMLYMYDRAYPKRLRNWTTTKWSVILYSSSYWQFLY